MTYRMMSPVDVTFTLGLLIYMFIFAHTVALQKGQGTTTEKNPEFSQKWFGV